MKLSKREKEVLNLASLGGTSKSIGKELFISARTVHVHVRNLRSKLGAKNIQHAVRLGFETCILYPEPTGVYEILTTDNDGNIINSTSDVEYREVDSEACRNDPKIVSVVVPLSENFNEGIQLLDLDLSPVPYSITDINKDK